MRWPTWLPLTIAIVMTVLAVLSEASFTIWAPTYSDATLPSDLPQPINNLRLSVEADPRFRTAENGSVYSFASYDENVSGRYPNFTVESIQFHYYLHGNGTYFPCGYGWRTRVVIDTLNANIPTVSGGFNETAMILFHYPPIFHCHNSLLNPTSVAVFFGVATVITELGLYLAGQKKPPYPDLA